MKKIFLILIFGLLGAMLWYLFIKKYDYQFETTAKYGPGAVAYELSEWKNFKFASGNSDGITLNDQDFQTLIQRVALDSSESMELRWELSRLNDSSTAISVNVLSPKNQLANRLAIINPFQKSKFVDSLKQNLLSFKRELNDHQSLYKLTPLAQTVESPQLECVCSTSRNIPITGKAGEMMATISMLENYILANKTQIDGYPFLKVTNWDREKDLIDFDFCFPVKNVDSLKPTSKLKLKKIPSQKSLKLTFNGNYRISHISWFDLLYIVQERGYEVNGGPLEVYYDNPRLDSDELNWKAEVYLPVKEK